MGEGLGTARRGRVGWAWAPREPASTTGRQRPEEELLLWPIGEIPTIGGRVAIQDLDLSQLQARLERRRGLRLQAQEGPHRGHRPRDVRDEGRAGVDAQLPALSARAASSASRWRRGSPSTCRTSTSTTSTTTSSRPRARSTTGTSCPTRSRTPTRSSASPRPSASTSPASPRSTSPRSSSTATARTSRPRACSSATWTPRCASTPRSCSR